jgi:hypothetical protein
MANEQKGNPMKTQCGCGCGEPARRSFRQGHDARLAWALLRDLHGDGTEGGRLDTLVDRFANAHPTQAAKVRERHRLRFGHSA